MKQLDLLQKRVTAMLIPRYIFAGEYAGLYDYFLTQPHKEKSFHKGAYLWAPSELIEQVYYIKSGIAQTLVEHENGYQKILFFHGTDTVFPGCHQTAFKIEQAIVTKAITSMETLAFARKDFYHMFQTNQMLNAITFESYAKYINLLIYETAHQEYNNSFIKLCNMLYLFSHAEPGKFNQKINLTQENMASILTINRVNVAKCLGRLRDEGIITSHRTWLEIKDPDGLCAHCSHETLDV